MNITVKHFSELSNIELMEIYRQRINIFIIEQNCPYEDIDGLDVDAYHVCVWEDGNLLAYCRVVYGYVAGEVSVGRVITVRRGAGLGKVVVEKGIEVAREKFNTKRIVIEAQKYAQEFYEKCGFHLQNDDVFDVDGIPHVRMQYDFE